MLLKLGYDLGKGGADGIFGKKTQEAIIDIQKKNHLDVDGIVGDATMQILKKLAADSSSGQMRVTANILNVRSGPGTNYPVIAGIKRGFTLTILEEKDGFGRFNGGWVSLQYLEKV